MCQAFFVSGYSWGLIRADEVQPVLFGIEDEDAGVTERDFSGLPAGWWLDSSCWRTSVGSGDDVFREA